EAGADVIACYLTDSEAAAQLGEELAKLGGDHAVVQADISDPQGATRLAGDCRDRMGSLDVVVHNAGAISHIPIGELSVPEWRRFIDTTLPGAFLVIQALWPLLKAGASIVSIGSRAAAAGIPVRAHYTAAKAGLAGLTRSLCKELGPKGIRVNL